MITTRPIEQWPGDLTLQRRAGSYKASPGRTRDDLIRELDLIGAEEAFVQAAYRPDQIRVDGLPRSGACPSHPGVIVTYLKDDQWFEFPCDRFTAAEQNLRAIVLCLQRLRLVEESGVRTCGRQYTGFARLPDADQLDSVRAAAQTIAQIANGCSAPKTIADILASPASYRLMFREAAKRAHPDVGGTRELFEQLTQAKERLDLHHG